MRYIPGEGDGEGRVVWSASDLKAAAECEFAWMRAVDAKIGRVAAVVEPEDETLKRAGRLGTLHEQRVLADYIEQFGEASVAVIPETRSTDAAALAAAVDLTNAALASDADVIYQAAFATEEFVGFADFLVRDPSTGSGTTGSGSGTTGSGSGTTGGGSGTAGGGSGTAGRWIVQDTKLARHARVTALMQLAAYVDQLDRLGVPRADRVELLLGDGSTSVHEVDDLLPVFRLRRERLAALIADRRLDLGTAAPPLAWGDDRGDLAVIACGRCATCDAEVTASRDLLLVAGIRPVQRQRLRAEGVVTIDDLAAAETPPARISADVFRMLRTQARLQLDSPAGGVLAPVEGGAAVPTFEVVQPQALGALPRPDRGDLFFDFEGDPLYTEDASTGSEAKQWGIDYLFGWVDDHERYTPLWAHSFAEEKRALETFLDIVALRRQQYPDMHIYHYAPYEPTHLLAMAARHGVREADVDRLLRDAVFVDLYPVVRRALRVGSRSYSIKKLEPLYMGDEVRTSDVQKGDDSIVKYVQARALEDDDPDAARGILADLADYNRYDCVSTRRLRDWLVDRAREAGLRPTPNPEPDETAYEPSHRALTLAKLATDYAAESADALALRLGSAAIDYYPREVKSFWATHFLRLREPLSLWDETRDVVVVDPAVSRVVEDWHFLESGRGSERRTVEIRGELAPGTRLSAGTNPFALYELPAPYPHEAQPRWIHSARGVKVVDVLDDGVVIEETAVGGVTWSQLPIALTPASPPPAGNQQAAIDAWADAVIAAAPGLPDDPATDLLVRRAPRTRRQAQGPEGEAQGPEGGLPVSTGDDVDAIVRAVLELDRSYLAVQGPPGTGKTYVGSHVIARLVRDHGFKIGVVAQSHAVVEHMLDRVVAAGVPAQKVAKAPKSTTTDAAPPSFTVIPKNGVPAFAAEQPDGFVIGGTAWDFAHEGRIPRRSLDLLVIDEAGQFSLASTIAVSLASTRLLLLGDPQQLPQVSQGTHPEPVDTSALGWVMDGSDVIPPEFGYFLARTRRMRPEVAAPVSVLSYRGELAAHPATRLRSLEGIEPGLQPVAVRHRGNATASPEEADVVVEIVRDLIGRQWRDIGFDDDDGSTPRDPRPLEQRDLIVVTPYNAQQVTVEEALQAAGFADVRVGTVDKFQGQEAAVAIVSLAASSGREAPRGLEFLLLRNRLNVAISRAMHTAYLVHSPELLDDLPRTAEGVARLSAFARLVGRA